MNINVLLCCVMLLWYVMLCYVMLCYVMLCYVKGIKQRRACLYPVLETCYDAAEHEKASRDSLCLTSVRPRHSMFLKLNINTSDAVLFLLENSF